MRGEAEPVKIIQATGELTLHARAHMCNVDVLIGRPFGRSIRVIVRPADLSEPFADEMPQSERVADMGAS